MTAEATAPGTPRERVWLVGLALIVLIGAVVRLIYLNQPMRADEAGTYIDFLRRPLLTAISWYPYPNNHLFYTLLEWFALRLLGNAPWVIRLVAFGAGVALIPASYAVGRALYSAPVGLLAAALVAASEHLIEYSTNGRGYTLLALETLALVWLANRLRQRRSARASLLYALTGALGFYTIPIMLYPFGAITLWLGLSLLAEQRGSLRWKAIGDLVLSVALAGGLTLLLYLPVFLGSGVAAVTSNSTLTRLPFETFAANGFELLRITWSLWIRDIPPPLLWLLIGGAIVSLVAYPRLSRGLIPLQVALIVWIEAVYLIQSAAAYARVFLFALPLALIFACAGLVYLLRLIGGQRWRGWRLATVAAAVVLAIGLSAAVIQSGAVWVSAQTGVAPDSPDLADLLGPRLRPGDVLLVSDRPTNILRYYFLRGGYAADAITLQPDGSPSRVYIMVNFSYDSLEALLRQGGLNPTEYAGQVIHRFQFSQLYQLDRRNGN